MSHIGWTATFPQAKGDLEHKYEYEKSLVPSSMLYSLEPKGLELHTLLQVSIKVYFYLYVALQTLGSSLAPFCHQHPLALYLPFKKTPSLGLGITLEKKRFEDVLC